MVRGFLRDAVLAIIGGLVIEPTLARLRVDVSHYLPQIWLGVVGFLIVDGVLRSKRFREWAIKHEASQTKGRKAMTYILVAVIGAIVFCICWFSITKLLNKPAEEAQGSPPPAARGAVPSEVRPTRPTPPGGEGGGRSEPSPELDKHSVHEHANQQQQQPQQAKNASITWHAYLQPDEPYLDGTLLAGIVWSKNYVDVRLDVSSGEADIRNLDFWVGLDTSIAGVGQISQFQGVSAFPAKETPAA